MSKRLIQRINEDGYAQPGGILNVSSFVNHQVDAVLMRDCAIELAALLRSTGATKVITVPISGLLVAGPVAVELGVPMIFLRDKVPVTMRADNAASVEIRSHTKGHVKRWYVNKEFVTPDDKVLFVDDFLASGDTAIAVGQLVRDAGAQLVGMAFLIAKTYENGVPNIRAGEARGWEQKSEDSEAATPSSASSEDTGAAAGAAAKKIPIFASAVIHSVSDGVVVTDPESGSW